MVDTTKETAVSPGSESTDDEQLLGDSESLVLAEGSRGRKQLALLVAAVGFWIFNFWILPQFLPGTIQAVIVALGLAVFVGGILKLSSTVDDRLRFALLHGSLPFWLSVMWYSSTQLIPRGQFGVAFLGGILVLYVISQLADPINNRNYLDLFGLLSSAAIATGTCAYLYTNYQAVAIDSVGRATQPELIMAVAFTAAMIFLTWRAFGLTFLIVVIAGIGYGLFGMFAPGPLNHPGLSGTRILRILVVSVDGFFGFLNRLVAAWIALFLLYAGLLKAYGAFDLILRLAVRSAKYIDSGIAQTAVVASAVIGSVNGSQTANAGMTGSFTIPLMKEAGIEPETAGGIESVASTAGQVLPPVMGAGAFVMASLITGVSYVDVIIAGLIPAFILVVSIVIAVHYVAAPQIEDPSMSGLIGDPLPTQQIVLEAIKYGVPLAVLIFILGVLQWTVMTAALYTSVSMIAFGIGIPIFSALINRESVKTAALDTTKQTLDGAREGVIVLAPVAIILASINGVVDILQTTGVPTAISLTLIELSGGVLLIAVILAMIICILLGLGMPTTAAYTIVALLIAPTLINQFFIPDFASHFFVFYAAILAGLTPPIATCVAVTCGISGGGFWTSCREALKISAPLFVLPFAFIYHPEIVSGVFNYASLSAGALALVGAISIIHGINYRFAFGRAPKYGLRVAFFVLGIIVMVHPEQIVQLGGVAAIGALYMLQIVAGSAAPLDTLKGIVGTVTGRRDQ